MACVANTGLFDGSQYPGFTLFQAFSVVPKLVVSEPLTQQECSGSRRKEAKALSTSYLAPLITITCDTLH